MNLCSHNGTVISKAKRVYWKTITQNVTWIDSDVYVHYLYALHINGVLCFCLIVYKIVKQNYVKSSSLLRYTGPSDRLSFVSENTPNPVYPCQFTGIMLHIWDEYENTNSPFIRMLRWAWWLYFYNSSLFWLSTFECRKTHKAYHCLMT